VGALFP